MVENIWKRELEEELKAPPIVFSRVWPQPVSRKTGLKAHTVV